MCHEHAFGAAEDDPFPAEARDFAVEGLGPGEGDVRPGEQCSVRRDMLLHKAGQRHRCVRDSSRVERIRKETRNYPPNLLSNLTFLHLFSASRSPPRPQWTPSSSQRSPRTRPPAPATLRPPSLPRPPPPSSAPPTPQTGNTTCPKRPTKKSLSSTRTQTSSG